MGHSSGGQGEDDRVLATRARAGDKAAWETIVRCYTPYLWERAYRILCDPGRSEDAVQEALARGWQSIHTYHGNGSLRGWFLAICRNYCIDELKRRSTAEIVFDFEGIDANSNSPSDERIGMGGVEQSIKRQQCRSDWECDTVHQLMLRKAFAALKPLKVRKSAILVLVRGLTREEAAEVMGVPPSTMRTWINEARKRLCEMIREDDDA